MNCGLKCLLCSTEEQMIFKKWVFSTIVQSDTFPLSQELSTMCHDVFLQAGTVNHFPLFHMQSTHCITPAHTKGPSVHIWTTCICYTFRHPFIKAWISVRGSVNIHFLKSFFFLHSFGCVPCLRTTAPSLRFVHLPLPFFCFQAQIQLDCGEDNICVPDLKLAVYGWEEVIFLWLYLMVLDVWP